MTRHIKLDGAVNFRDLGGYETTDGRHLRWRRLFRADGLSKLSPPDRATMRKLGIATVIDLRSKDELKTGTFPTNEVPVVFHHIPFVEKLEHPDRFQMEPGLLASQYLEMAEDAALGIGRVITLVATPLAHPVIVHCTAGKDRTGVLFAVLLGLLGVSETQIIEDYALSAEAMANLRLKLIKQYPKGKEIIERADELFSARPRNIELLLDFLRDQYGSIDAYGKRCGVQQDTIDHLGDALLE